MTQMSHLILSEISMPPASDWCPGVLEWCFARVAEGHGYWMRTGEIREINTGDVLIIIPGEKGAFRASQLGAVNLQCFLWNPDLLTGVLSLSERHYFTSIGSQNKNNLRILPAGSLTARHFEALCASNGGDNPLTARSRLLQLVGEVFGEEIWVQSNANIRIVSAADRLENLVSRMTDSELMKLEPAELARRCCCSLRHFGRLFYERFGVSLRSHQTKLRLQKASQLLSSGDNKIIDVALDSGYHNLGLFNKMFKKHWGMTPSQWRQKQSNKRRSRVTGKSVLCFIAAFCINSSLPASPVPPATNAAPTFKVLGYQIQGNTILTPDIVDRAVTNCTGTNVTIATIQKARANLTLAYRERGFIAVDVALPQQTLTNDTVRMVVTEGKLTDISIFGNRYFSKENILRSLPSLQTNITLNNLVFQQDLDQSNANRDRQIYPEIGPGPEPGTTSLKLKVKDRFPLHFNGELNNQSTPGTPELRFNLAAQYNNLWQLDHQIGVQYLFSPGEYKSTPFALDLAPYFFDRPLIDSYSGFYRMPLTPQHAPENYSNLSSRDFGYDEVTKRFRPPPPAGGGMELLVYASRSVSDTGRTLDNHNVTPSTGQILADRGGLQISDDLFSETVTFNEDLGFRINQPLQSFKSIDSFLNYGLDYKAFRSYMTQDRIFQAQLLVPRTTDPQSIDDYDSFLSPPNQSSQFVNKSVNYLPFTLNWDASRRDSSGLTCFNLYNTLNITKLSSSTPEMFARVANTPDANGNFYIMNAGVNRQQNLGGDWQLIMKAAGQWASQPLISNEQIGLGGLAGPRGYMEGEQYGDAGWRATIEPQTPTIEAGMVDGTMPMRLRFSAFTDYGMRYLYKPVHNSTDDTSKGSLSMLGVGVGVTGTIGQTYDFRLTFGVPILSTQATPAGSVHVYFGVAAHF